MNENFLDKLRAIAMAAVACAVLVVNAAGFPPDARADDVSSPPAVDQVFVPSDLQQMQTFRTNAYEVEIMVDGLNAFLLRHVYDRKWSPSAHEAWKKWMNILNNRLEMLVTDSENYRPAMSTHADPRVAAVFTETEKRVEALADAERKLIAMESAIVVKEKVQP
jgi:arylsulfatase A-like enzyme